VANGKPLNEDIPMEKKLKKAKAKRVNRTVN